MKPHDRLSALRDELSRLETRRSNLLQDIARIEQEHKNRDLHPITNDSVTPSVTHDSPPAEKISLFRSLFKGREDVYPKRFENRRSGKTGYSPACNNEWHPDLCKKPKVKCVQCNNQDFEEVTDAVIEAHLRGTDTKGTSFTAGVYPMLTNETCWFLAADFDKSTWEEDLTAFRQTAKSLNIHIAAERSRSGNGAHAWIFFNNPISCSLARTLGTHLLNQTMESRPEIGLDSYDRLFPNQNTLPEGGLGNLIALPLQGESRRQGNSVFVDELLVPHEDQWAYLSTLPRYSRKEIEALIPAQPEEITGVSILSADDDTTPWRSQTANKKQIHGPFPKAITIILANMIFIPKATLSPSFRNAIIRIAAFQNPEFYKKQAMRMPTWNMPRLICCAELHAEHVALPRGCLEPIVQLFCDLNIEVSYQDERITGIQLDVTFNGELYEEQKAAAKVMLEHEIGTLSATTAFGKTVVAAYLAAKRNTNTLILVHRRQLLEQWRERLVEFLSIDRDEIGLYGGGKKKLQGKIDIAILQSLVRSESADALLSKYGHLIIDECHHISAPSFEAIAKGFRGRYVTGLSATLARKDGHHPIIFMNCGPIRHHVSARQTAGKRPFLHRLIVRETSFELPPEMELTQKSVPMATVYSCLMSDPLRNKTILNDVLSSLKAGRRPILLTERREQLDHFRGQLENQVDNLILLQGGMGKKRLAAAREAMALIPSVGESRLILATGRYVGEGFDDPQLDTLFLALPISWKGTIAQYAGRLHRLHHGKQETQIYDYADLRVPMLARMFKKRLSGYRAIGYEEEST